MMNKGPGSNKATIIEYTHTMKCLVLNSKNY